MKKYKGLFILTVIIILFFIYSAINKKSNEIFSTENSLIERIQRDHRIYTKKKLYQKEIALMKILITIQIQKEDGNIPTTDEEVIDVIKMLIETEKSAQMADLEIAKGNLRSKYFNQHKQKIELYKSYLTP